MREDEVVIFEANPYHQDAVKIWKWDDHGKALGGGRLNHLSITLPCFKKLLIGISVKFKEY
jgi:predicted HD phosphohydrolase